MNSKISQIKSHLEQDEKTMDARVQDTSDFGHCQGERKVRMVAQNLKSAVYSLVFKDCRPGFTMIEVMVVVVIISIVAMMAIPLISSAGSMQLKSAANMIAADLEYAKSMAISRQKIYAVVFNDSSESYEVQDPNGLIPHPVRTGLQYLVNFKQDSRLSSVDITGVDFDTTNTVKFDYLGSPLNGNNTPLNSGVVSLQAGESALTVNVEPVTGYISISE